MAIGAKEAKMLNRMNSTAEAVNLGDELKVMQEAINGGADGTPDARLDDLQVDSALFKSAMSGDLAFKCTPATTTCTAAEQNVGVAQAMAVTLTGTVTSDGGGDIDVTITANGLTDGAKTVSVTVVNADDATAVALAIKTALDLNAEIGHADTGMFTIAVLAGVITFTKNTESANDETMEFAVVTDDAVFEELVPLTAETVDTAGVAPYTRNVLVQLVDTESKVHTWFNGIVPVTIADTADGAASVVGGLNPVMVNGAMTIVVELQGLWATDKTNTLTVAQKTVLGYTVAAKTSIQTTT